jgi:hypothetical protein
MKSSINHLIAFLGSSSIVTILVDGDLKKMLMCIPICLLIVTCSYADKNTND